MEGRGPWLLGHWVLDNLRGAQGIVNFRKRYGDTRVEAAATRALAYASPHYRTLKTILENGLDQQPLDEDGFDRLGKTYTGRGRFSRDTRQDDFRRFTLKSCRNYKGGLC